MKAITLEHGSPALSERPRPQLLEPDDAIVRVRVSGISLTDALFAGDPSCRPADGTVLGHQGVGEVVEVGDNVQRVAVGQRVVVSPIVACGECAYCRVGFYAQCVKVKLDGAGVGGAYLGGPSGAHAFDGVHAEYVRVPFADVGLLPLIDGVEETQAILFSEAMPLGYFGAKLARICAGDRVAVFGADPAALMAVLTSLMVGAGSVLVVDDSEQRLEVAAEMGVQTYRADWRSAGDQVRTATRDRGVQCGVLTAGAGLDYAGDSGAGERIPSADALTSAVHALSRDSTLAAVGVYPNDYSHFPIGTATAKYVTVKAAACNYSKYLQPLTNMWQAGVFTATVLEQPAAFTSMAKPDAAYTEFATGPHRWAVVDWS